MQSSKQGFSMVDGNARAKLSVTHGGGDIAVAPSGRSYVAYAGSQLDGETAS